MTIFDTYKPPWKKFVGVAIDIVMGIAVSVAIGVTK
jgi:hypothetical protein